MIDKIIKAVSLALNGEFGDSYKVYTEEVSQDMETPCFFIICDTPRAKLFFNRKYFRSNIFCIQYVPCTEDIRAECGEVTERLFGCLEYIRAGDFLLRGTKMEPETEDGILYFFVNYDFFVCREKDTEKMGALSGHIGVKGQVENGSKENNSSRRSEKGGSIYPCAAYCGGKIQWKEGPAADSPF